VSDAAPDGALAGLDVVAFEARRAAELGRMLERHGARVRSAPALREARCRPSPRIAELARALDAGDVAALVLLTGVGTRALAPLPRAGRAPRSRGSFARTRIVARGPKPLAALRELGIEGAVAVPTPNTWRGGARDARRPGLPAGGLVAVQEYGGPPTDLLAGLAARRHPTLSVSVYRWELPPTRPRSARASTRSRTARPPSPSSRARRRSSTRSASRPTPTRSAPGFGAPSSRPSGRSAAKRSTPTAFRSMGSEPAEDGPMVHDRRPRPTRWPREARG
jgi:hypothetical protein